MLFDQLFVQGKSKNYITMVTNSLFSLTKNLDAWTFYSWLSCTSVASDKSFELTYNRETHLDGSISNCLKSTENSRMDVKINVASSA